LIGVLFLQNYPASSEPKNLVRISDTVEIRKNLEAIINTPKGRNFQNIDVLDSIANYIKLQFLKSTNRVTVQKFEARNNSYINIIASFAQRMERELL
jgi:hypothetical protein